MDLFNGQSDTPKPKAGAGTAPLAARMRPQTLDEIIGQDHILGAEKLLRRAIEADRISSVILYGPPGCGKTTLAEVIAKTTNRRFERTSGVLANVAILRKHLETSSHWKKMNGQETILFIDEIHRFNKAQQDVLLPYVENGDIILIGATTHNPFFFINTPLNSRSQIFQLQPLDEESVIKVLNRALTAPTGLKGALTGLSCPISTRWWIRWIRPGISTPIRIFRWISTVPGPDRPGSVPIPIPSPWSG